MALIDTFQYGDLVRLSASFKDENGVAVDPEFVLCEVLQPDGVTKIVLNYLNDPALVRTGVGEYHYDLSCDFEGLYVYRFESTGNGQAAQRGMLRVEPEFI